MTSSNKSYPKVAVITRTKDRSLFLERAIESAQQQTMKDFVQVVLNDGGDEKAAEKAVSKHQKQHPERIKLLHNKTPVGHTKALNQAIQQVDSRYIAILDDDDTWHPEYLQKTVDHLDKTGAKGVVTKIDQVIEEVDDGKIKHVSQERYRPDITEVNLYAQCIDNCTPTVAFVYQREVHEELNGYDETLGVAEDWDFTLRFLVRYDIDFLDTKESLTFYHHRPEAIGPAGNSVFAGRSTHDYYLNLLANRYLREDIKQGRMGLGYIINNLRYQRKNDLWLDQREEARTVRIEALANNLTSKAIDALRIELPDIVRHSSFANRVLHRVKRIRQR